MNIKKIKRVIALFLGLKTFYQRVIILSRHYRILVNEYQVYEITLNLSTRFNL
jgi:hypothetical protein